MYQIMDFQNFLVFAFASLMLNITPGNDMIFVATNATNRGFRAGLMASLGIAVGCLVHIVAASLGVSAVVARSAILFDLLKYVGAAYLIFIGIKSLLSKTQTFDIQQVATKRTDFDVFKTGVVTNVLNPKVALFFLAFLPQFLPPQYWAASSWQLIVLLGLWFNFSGTVVNIAVAAAFGRAGNFLQRHPTFVRWQEKLTGAILILLGLRVAFLKK